MSEQHKHAAVFESAMQGKADEWEVNCDKWDRYFWVSADEWLQSIYLSPDSWTSRRKQKTHVVNGFTVPEPLWEHPESGDGYHVEMATYPSFFESLRWTRDSYDVKNFERGIAHATAEGAIANCKARL